MWLPSLHQRSLVSRGPGCKVSYPSLTVSGLLGPSGRQTRETQTFGRGVREGRRGRQKQGPRNRRGERQCSRGLAEADGGRLGIWIEPAGWDQTVGWPAEDYKKDSEVERQGGPKRQRQRGRLPSGLFSSQQPRVFLSLEPVEPSAPPPPKPASQSACLSARCPPPARLPEQAGAPTAPSSCLPPPALPHFLLLSLCQTHLELFKPKYSAPSPLQPDSSAV